MFTKMKNKKGFTLVELLIVLAIIAILAAIAIPMYKDQMEKARVKVDEANMRAAKSMAVAAYMLEADTTGTKTFHFGMSDDGNISIVTANQSKGFNKAKANGTGSAVDSNIIAIVVTDGGQITPATWVAKNSVTTP